MEIIRKEELQRLLSIIQDKPNGKFLISGSQGCGKTFLLNILGQALQEQGKKVKYYDIPFHQTDRSIYNDLYYNECIYLLDGLDKAYNSRRIINEIKNSKGCYVCTAQKNTFEIRFDYELRLEPLTTDQALLLISDYLGETFSKQDVIEDIIKGIGKENITPRIIAEKISGKLKGKKFDKYFENLGTNVHQLYTYGEGLSLQHPEIIVPERKIIKVPNEIKNDISVITHSLLELVASNPKILYEITPRQFEELVCELFERKGYNVQLTKQTRDGGKDLIVLNNSVLGEMVIYAECKRYSKELPVNVGLVRQLYGTVEADRATAGIMVTTSYFSKDARRFQEKIKGRMNFIDYSELMKQILECR